MSRIGEALSSRRPHIWHRGASIGGARKKAEMLASFIDQMAYGSDFGGFHPAHPSLVEYSPISRRPAAAKLGAKRPRQRAGAGA